ncbi:TPA: hypothetical protein DIV55_06725 [Patescibacteria group bacterium]|uniref:Uncharacterized protein n=2 Tax=Candidatus Gottesmaniibacteriota TaxID=1752720 RepID=A0A0G1UPZ8_9BACT|nr:MAG: hypothetical protein UY16_C0002G0006 [Candidatus Gottesmanbacteria bacterium GW2011_GWA2_47_9]KKU96219.1 MAG: hypothetical protein UY27_C0002G0004 [Candidatus Gottesmanbacteria bacterium GW2011_GWA1_48_13]HCS79398.1 hypothetical protein [Patescibacteria group bacterium]
MNDLPDSASPAGTNNPTNTPIIQSGTGVGSISKEIEGGVGLSEAGLHDVSGQEMELPKEVAAVGVKVQPTTVTIPQPVAQMGVISAGTNVPAQPAPAVALPLTDDQIAVGLKASITSSIRWLAEWCVLRLKQLHKKIIKSP